MGCVNTGSVGYIDPVSAIGVAFTEYFALVLEGYHSNTSTRMCMAEAKT